MNMLEQLQKARTDALEATKADASDFAEKQNHADAASDKLDESLRGLSDAGFKYAEIADGTGLKLNEVSQRIARARRGSSEPKATEKKQTSSSSESEKSMPDTPKRKVRDAPQA